MVLVKEEGLRTERLWLRPWRDGDLDAFASMNADPAVMRYFPAPLSRDETAASMARYRAHLDEHGFGFLAVELRADSRFVGALGLSIPRFVAHFTPCVEIGWRLARDHWGRGYATEGAQAALRDGFARLRLKEIVAFTTPANLRSRRVMEKLGMRRVVEDDFDHPLLAPRAGARTSCTGAQTGAGPASGAPCHSRIDRRNPRSRGVGPRWALKPVARNREASAGL